MLKAFNQDFMQKYPGKIQSESIEIGEFSIQINSGQGQIIKINPFLPEAATFYFLLIGTWG